MSLSSHAAIGTKSATSGPLTVRSCTCFRGSVRLTTSATRLTAGGLGRAGRLSTRRGAAHAKRIDAFFDPDHAGWFTSVQAVKDVTLALGLSNGGAPLPVTEAARDAYRQLAADWMADTGHHRTRRVWPAGAY